MTLSFIEGKEIRIEKIYSNTQHADMKVHDNMILVGLVSNSEEDDAELAALTDEYINNVVVVHAEAISKLHDYMVCNIKERRDSFCESAVVLSLDVNKQKILHGTTISTFANTDGESRLLQKHYLCCAQLWETDANNEAVEYPRHLVERFGVLHEYEKKSNSNGRIVWGQIMNKDDAA